MCHGCTENGSNRVYRTPFASRVFVVVVVAVGFTFRSFVRPSFVIIVLYFVRYFVVWLLVQKLAFRGNHGFCVYVCLY